MVIFKKRQLFIHHVILLLVYVCTVVDDGNLSTNQGCNMIWRYGFLPSHIVPPKLNTLFVDLSACDILLLVCHFFGFTFFNQTFPQESKAIRFWLLIIITG